MKEAYESDSAYEACEKLMKLATEGDNDAANNAVTFSKISFLILVLILYRFVIVFQCDQIIEKKIRPIQRKSSQKNRPGPKIRKYVSTSKPKSKSKMSTSKPNSKTKISTSKLVFNLKISTLKGL